VWNASRQSSGKTSAAPSPSEALLWALVCSEERATSRIMKHVRNNALARVLRRIGLSAALLEQIAKLSHGLQRERPGAPTFGLTARQPDEPSLKIDIRRPSEPEGFYDSPAGQIGKVAYVLIRPGKMLTNRLPLI
jgi:hypothetical protein